MLRKKKIIRPALLFILIIGVILLVIATGRWQQQILSRVTYPLILVQHRCVESVDRWRLEKMDKASLLELLEKTVAEARVLRRRLIELESLTCFDRESRELRNFSKRYHLVDALTVQIIQKQFSPEAHYFLVNAGENQGIKVDMVAFYEHHLVGRVSEVYPAYSKIVLITDRTSKVSAVCTKTGARGILEGLNDSMHLSLNFVNHFDELSVGDFITSYGAGLIFPRGLALGKVTHVELAGVLKKVDIEPLITFADLSFCLIASSEKIEIGEGAEPEQFSFLASQNNNPLISHNEMGQELTKGFGAKPLSHEGTEGLRNDVVVKNAKDESVDIVEDKPQHAIANLVDTGGSSPKNNDEHGVAALTHPTNELVE